MLIDQRRRRDDDDDDDEAIQDQYLLWLALDVLDPLGLGPADVALRAERVGVGGVRAAEAGDLVPRRVQVGAPPGRVERPRPAERHHQQLRVRRRLVAEHERLHRVRVPELCKAPRRIKNVGLLQCKCEHTHTQQQRRRSYRSSSCRNARTPSACATVRAAVSIRSCFQTRPNGKEGHTLPASGS